MARQKVARKAAPSAAGDASDSGQAEVELAQASGKDVRGDEQTPAKHAKWPWILLIVLAILVGFFVLADHLARQYAERKVVAERRRAVSRCWQLAAAAILVHLPRRAVQQCKAL